MPVAPNPLLAQLRIPGETFKLPSGGIFYNNNELDESVINGEVYVYPMTAIDEITIKTPDKLFSGDAIVDIFAHCIPQIKNPRMMFSKDIDFLLVCLRMLSYGQTISLTATHNCTNAKEHSYDVELREFIAKSKSIDPTTITQLFTVTMDNGQVVHLQPARFGDIVRFYQSLDRTDTNSQEVDYEKLKITMIENVVGMIHDVNNITEKSFITEWLKSIPVKWTYKIGDAIGASSDWGPNFKATVICTDCNQPYEISAPINPIAFFM